MGSEAVQGQLGEVRGVEIVGRDSVIVATRDTLIASGLHGAVESERTTRRQAPQGFVHFFAVLQNHPQGDDIHHPAVARAVHTQVPRLCPIPAAQVTMWDVIADDIAVAVDVADAENKSRTARFSRLGRAGELNSYQTNVQYLTAQIFVYLFLHSVY